MTMDTKTAATRKTGGSTISDPAPIGRSDGSASPPTLSRKTKTTTSNNSNPTRRENNNGRNNNNISNNTAKQLAESTVMAPNFVPHSARQILLVPVNQLYQARELPNMMEHVDRTYEEAVPHHPRCNCPMPHPMGFPSRAVPVVPVDPYFAIRQETRQRTSQDFSMSFQRLESARRKDDYLNILQSLLREEFEERMMLYERYTQYQAKVQVNRDATGQATLQIPGIHNARPAIEPGDNVFLRPQESVELGGAPSPEIHAQVIRTVRGKLSRKKGKKGIMEADKVVITWLIPRFQKFLNDKLFAVRFLPSTTDLQRSFAALQWIRALDPQVARELLFPTETPQIPMDYVPKDQFDQDLNEKQSRFVSMVLTRTRHPSMYKVRPPMILTGPAGTGKTKTLLASILKVLADNTNGNHHQKRILVCTPSHTACDVVSRRLSRSLSSQMLFRMYPSDRPVEMVPVELLPYVSQGTTGEFILPSIEKLMAFQVIVCTCCDAHILVMAGLTNSRLRIRRQCLKNYAVGLLKLGNIKVSGEIVGAEEPHFSHLFIDEAAQATEPESLIPLSVVVDDCLNSIKVEISLAGDPRQLSPDIYSPWAATDLQTSLLERLLRLPEMGGRSHMMGPPTEDSWTSMDELIEYSFQKKEDHDHLSVFLTTSYRGHPSFLMMPSKLFYFDKLRSVHPLLDNADDKWCSVLRKIEATSTIVNPGCVKQRSWPFHFRGVAGKDQSAAVESFWGTNSWSNPEEASEILGVVQTLVAEGISTQSIGIMAAFRGQVVLIRRILRDKGLGAVNVGIVEDYQAVEREVIILSLTRSNNTFLANDIKRRIGLFQQPKRMNVALTRAENLLVVVGDPKLMEKDQTWKQWLEFCFHNGLWYGKQGNETIVSALKC